VDPARGLALIVGSELGDFASTLAFADGYLERGPAGLSPLLFPSTVMNTMAATAAIGVGARELALTLNAPTVAGELAVARAAAAVASGRVDAALAGGVDELNPFVAETLSGLGAAGRRGEGATFLVLEAGPVARARGASILGRIAGFAWNSVAAGPWQVGRAVESRAITSALARAGCEAPGFVYRSASGDAPRDAWEARVLSAALGRHASSPTTLAGRLGQHAGLGALHVAAAAWSARAGLLPAGDSGPPERVTGPGLVHGLARGGIHVAVVVAGPAAQRADAVDAGRGRAEPARA
jgi:3-oxoacyl-[acyl-carrier-protein] synthase II